MNPHHFEKWYKEMELFLWDCDFARRSGGSSLRGPPPLLPMQRRLIEFVREGAPKRFAEHSLSKVWIGDFPIPPTREPSYPIDVTCQAVESFLRHSYELLTPFSVQLKERGWKFVEDGLHNPWTGEADAFPKAVGDMELPEVTIIHAPQGDHQGKSQCRN